MQHRPLFSQANIADARKRQLTVENQDAKRKLLADWKNGLASGKIQSLNERKLQSEFLNKIFGEVLGYAYEKQLTTWQLEHEYKVDFDGKTPDGVLGHFTFDAATKATLGDVQVIIELKGPLTNLDKKQNRKDFPGTPVEQAFSYVPKLSKPCPWVIVSNCQEIRLYRYALGMTQYEKFDLLTLDDHGLNWFYTLLQKDQLFLRLTDSPIEQLFLAREQELNTITNRFYADYKRHRESLFAQIRRDNPDTPPNDLFRATQKLIDRLIFICFARDLELVENVLKKVMDAADASFGQNDDKIAQELRRAFLAFDKGYKERNIPPFNGGLFRGETLLDSLKIKDFRLADLMAFLNSYNFQGQLNVNVLGHIFEQSIADIEEIKAQLQHENPVSVGELERLSPAFRGGTETSKRKKEGVFYTPDYITRYMVEQAVGGWLTDRETEILHQLGTDQLPELTIADYETVRLSATGQYERNAAIALHVAFWEAYQCHLEAIRVLDPACGSGAFLTQVFDFLWERWRVLKEETYKLATPYDQQLRNLAARTAPSIGPPPTPYREWEIKKTIVSRNLYGVDLNPESVEITKLALWLKTASKTETLASLDDHIRQGNSLVSDPAVTEHAFDWNTEFAGLRFDVVVGNPPYVRADSPGNTADFRAYMMNRSGYETLAGKWDLYVPFIELSMRILAEKGKNSLIIPDAYTHADYAEKSLNYLVKNEFLSQIDYFPGLEIFDGVGVQSVIITSRKQPFTAYTQRIFSGPTNHTETVSAAYPATFRLDATPRLIGPSDSRVPLPTVCYISKGIVGNSDERHYTGEFEVADLLSPKKDATHPKLYYEGKDIQKWWLAERRWIEYGTDRSPGKWSRPAFPELFESGPKIVAMRSPGLLPRNFLDTEQGYFNESAIGLKRWCDLAGVENRSLKMACKDDTQRADFERVSAVYSYSFLLAILNSTLIAYELNSNRRSNIHIYPDDYRELYLPIVSDTQRAQLATLADDMLTFSAQVQKQTRQLADLLQTDLGAAKLTEKLLHWPALDWPGLQAELKKQKVEIPLKRRAEWQSFFDDERAAVLALQARRTATDAQIDALVYALYGLTDAEIGLVSGRSAAQQ